jgi:hypothetical protein
MATLIYQPPASVSSDVYQVNQVASHDMADKTPQQTSSFFKGEFSFVNKDAKNIDSKDHNAAVLWHVMNRYERWKKQEQAKKLRASANVPVGPMSTATPSQSVRRHSVTAKRSTRLTSHQAVTLSTSTPFTFDPWMPEPTQQAGYPRQSPTLPPGGVALPSRTSTPSTQSSILEDPFSSMWNTSTTSLDMGTSTDVLNSFDVSSSPLLSDLIAFAYGNLVANSWPTESKSVHGVYEISHSWEDITAITQDRCYSNAYLTLLATAAADANDDQSLLVQARQFQRQAMTELRQRVARKTPQDLLTLKAILKLFLAETIVDNTAVARVHLKMLRNMVTAGGGVILLDPWFREDLLSCDCYFALKYGTRPTLPAQEWTPGPLSQPWKARLVSAGIFGEHSPTLDPLLEHPVLKTAVTDLRELFQAHEYVLMHDVPTDDQLLRWRQLRKFDCVSRLADHYTNLTIYPHLYDKPNTQALTTIATALMTNMIMGCPEPVRFGLKLLNELKQRSQESQGEASKEELRLHLWATYVGSLAERVHPVASSDAGYFTSAMRALVKQLRVEDLEEMKAMLRRFLLSEKLHLEIESGRAFRTKDFRKGLYACSGTSWREPLMMESGSLSTEGIVGAGKQRAEGV